MDLLFRVTESKGAIQWALNWFEADKAIIYIKGTCGNVNASNANIGHELRKSTMLEF